MKKEFTTNELLKMWKLVKKEKEELDNKPGANEFTIRDYEVLIDKLECNINHDILNNK